MADTQEDVWSGLSTQEALSRLSNHFDEVVYEFSHSGTRCINSGEPPHRVIFPGVEGTIVFLTCGALLIIGAVDIDNNINIPLVVLALVCVLLLVISKLLDSSERRQRRGFSLDRVLCLKEKILKDYSNIRYSPVLEQYSDDMLTHQVLRDGREVALPKMLLVKGDIILLRSGQVCPCEVRCENGIIKGFGEKVILDVEGDAETGGVKPLKPLKGIVRAAPVADHIHQCLFAGDKHSPLDLQLAWWLNVHWLRVVPVAMLLATVTVAVRHFSSDEESLFGTRFVFSIPALIMFPVLFPAFPFLYSLAIYWSNRQIANRFGLNETTWKSDLVAVLGCLTGVSFVDKKGLLSPPNPCIDKIVVFKHDNVGSPVDGSGCDLTLSPTLSPRVLDLSSVLDCQGRCTLDFDDPRWRIDFSSVSPIALNLALNSCMHSRKYNELLDHLASVVVNVPRTIAASNRRCMCQLPNTVGFFDNSLTQFDPSTALSIAVYKKQPGEAPVPGLTKHLTPLEMAFCTLNSDDRNLHPHLLCQGTADIVLQSCSHVWDGSALSPMTSRLSHAAKDFYHRHAMTGYCLALSYRPVGEKVNPSLGKVYVELPLDTAAAAPTSDSLVRALSIDAIDGSQFFSCITTAKDVAEKLMRDHVLCGLVVMQYEALPCAVQLVEALEAECVRFVYFSKENELRSRVFAEKLGLEAGWNCHVSLGDEDTEDDANSENHDKDNLYRKLFQSRRVGLSTRRNSDVGISNLDCESLLRVSPTYRRSSSTSAKVGPLANKARLPRGVDRVRPHLEEVDNVPLLVGLLTDTLPETNTQMVQIMQEYGEVVLAVGSSLNSANIGVFQQADMSICVEPVADQGCLVRNLVPDGDRMGGPSTASLATQIMALATHLQLPHEKLLALPSLVRASRHRLASIRSSLLLVVFASFSLSFSLFLSALFGLPLLFTTGQVFLTALVHVPLLFLGTFFSTFEPQRTVIRIAPKNCRGSWSDGQSAFLVFILQCLPPIAVVLVMFFIMLIRHSSHLCSFSDVVCGMQKDAPLSTQHIRHIAAFMYTVFLCVQSVSYVHWQSALWSELPLTAPLWLPTILLIIATQIGYSYANDISLFTIFPLAAIIVSVVFSIFFLLINEGLKLHRLRQFSRDQRRTRLAFETKLGMNSPY